MNNHRNQYIKKICVTTLVATAGILTAGMLSGCNEAYEEEENIVIVEQEEEPQEYKLTTVVKGDVALTKSVRCTYTQLDAQEVRFDVSGKMIEKVYVTNGDKVTKGQLLAELSGGNKDKEIEQLRYQIARNKMILEHVDEAENMEISRRWLDFMYQSGQSSEEDRMLREGIEELQKSNEYTREDCRDAIELDEKQLNQLLTEQRQSRVYAEFDGVISDMEKDLEGSTSNRDKVIMKVTDNSQCLFVIEDMTDAGCVKPDQELDMSIITATGSGQLKMLPFEMDTWEDKMLFYISKSDDHTVIEAGDTGNLTLILDSRSNVLMLPIEAVHSAEGKDYVYVVNADGGRDVKWVSTGLVGNSTIEITEGLEEGEKVVLR